MKRKKLLSILLTAALIFTMLPVTFSTAYADEPEIWDGTTDTSWYNPSESEFTLTTAAQLAGLAELVNGGNTFIDKTIKLGADITLNDTTSWENWDDSTVGLNTWTPVGSFNNGSGTAFKGEFDGRGHTISGIYISTTNDEKGLFGFCTGGTIENLSVTQSYIKGGYFVGAIAGSAQNEIISDCHFTGKMTGIYEVGGIVGSGEGIMVSDCSTDGLISATDKVGGITGKANSGIFIDVEVTSNITGCHSTADVSGNESVGGIVGFLYGDGTVTACYSTGNVTASLQYAGGIAGAIGGSTISNCYATGYITGLNTIGGIVGNADSQEIFDMNGEVVDVITSVITECYSTGDVSGTSAIGGIVGWVLNGGIVSKCYSTGDVSAVLTSVGGIAGVKGRSTTINCYATGYIKGSNFVGGIVGYSGDDSDTSTINNCISMNYAVAVGSSGLAIYRVSDLATADNYAWEDMLVLKDEEVYDSSLTYSGATPVTTEELKAATLWQTAGFTAEYGWTYVAGKKPILTNTGGSQNPDLPLHIDPFPDGTGTANDPYKISRAEQLVALARYINAGTGSYASAYYELQNDIDLSGIQQWKAIGMGEPDNFDCSHPFSGSFDGKGYEIRNMEISGMDNYYQGLFGYIDSGGIVKNVILTDCDITCLPEQVYTGGIAGYVESGAVIERCVVSGSISGYSEVGGIAGAVNGTVRLCRSEVTVPETEESQACGGIAGNVRDLGVVENCYTTGNVAGRYAGNIAGTSVGTIKNCYATGNATGEKDGNIVGDSEDGFEINCYYLDSAAPGSEEVPGSIEAKTAAELATAKMAWILNTTNGTEDNSGIWAQGTTPVFADNTHKAVYRLKLEGCTTPAIYSNPDGTVTLPSSPTGTNGMTFLGWYKDAAYSIPYTAPAVLENDDIIYGNFSSQSSEEGGNSGGNGEGAIISPPAPTYNADVKGGGTLNVTVEASNASVDVSELGSSIASGGSKTITIPEIPGATSYTLGISAEHLSVYNGNGTLTFETENGSMTIPADMLSNIAGVKGKKAQITIGQGDKSGLPEDIRETIGNRPVVQLTLAINGVKTEWNNPNAPVTISIPYKPTAEELANPEGIVIWYIDGSGNAVCVPNGRYDPATGTVTFTTTHFSYYAVSYKAVSFRDVPKDAWYAKAVSFIATREITAGTGEGNFSPDDKLTRGQFVVMLMRAYGISPDANPKDNFADAGNTWYTGYLAAAKRLGISAGVGNNMFAPNREITRQEMFTLLYNALKVIGQLPEGKSGKTLSLYNDAGDIASWGVEAMKVLVETGVVSGSGGKLLPKDTTTRAQMAQVLYQLLSK